MMKKFKNNVVANIFALAGLVGAVTACEDPYEDSTYVNDENLPPLALTLSADTAASGWVEVLKYADMYSALNYALDPFTVFFPTNEALDSFYVSKGVTSIQDLGQQYARDLVNTHTVLDSLKTEEIQKESYLTNLAGEKLYVVHYMNDARVFGLTNEALTSRLNVTEAQIKAYNGYMYRIDGVLNPLNESVYALLKKGGNTGDANRFDIMDQALQATGWADSLDVIQDTIWYTSGNYSINRRQYTLLAVSDDTFEKDGIATFDALVSKLGAGTDYTEKSNELNKYVSYHILNSMKSYLDLLSPMNIVETDEETGESRFANDSVKLMDTYAEGFVLQYTRIGSNPNQEVSYVFNLQSESAQLINDNSNVLAKNGYIHELDGYLPVWEPEQTTVIWDLADYSSVKNRVMAEGDNLYQPSEPVTTECKVALSALDDVYTYEMGSNNSSNSSYYPITYVNCKKNVSAANNKDRVVFNLGYLGWVNMKTPTLVRGKYRVELDFVYTLEHSFMRTISDGNGGLLKMTFDDMNEILVSPYTTVSKNTVGVYSTVLYEEIEFENTATHKMNFVVMDPAASTNNKFSLQFDCIRFIPITE
ncbi:MAG: DUF5108 domain-containing protein [Bacteroidaceae bacterium]|nr:DUF5108 domain-containing protein [Bacteroidaceae bacterium]